ncbi:CNPV306 hypothetical protein [Canarypox virus]|uniref:Uncharacterized protein CNPV306 n=2 Tax=Avipoxvirus TaxID=10260 RepID=Q6VZ41_CNPV|nr:CNPV306 hypothetical protein [Canarypox virus]AAR83652.1 CNPV306 hypothetical protein [Canarypox virus]AWD84782.1 hypothetical protein CNPV306 [Canarypox virus]UOX38618.1 hypothetical protein [Finch poxvirus]UOX38953.1 hypothetical protein [Finch poxvirus]
MYPANMKKFANLSCNTIFSVIAIMLSLILYIAAGYFEAVMLQEGGAIRNMIEKGYYPYCFYMPRLKSFEYQY